MKKIPFMKMAGAGNDFIVIDAVKRMDVKRLAMRMCDRTSGIGADGLLILDKSNRADYRMRIINADSSEAEMCGNGARCMAAYIMSTCHPLKKLFSIETKAGVILAESRGEMANVRLSEPQGYRSEVPLKIFGQKINACCLNTGVPHAVIYVEALEKINVAPIGRVIRNHPLFQPKGTNVNFVEQVTDSLIHVRTYERGVENETKACGTGSVASAIITYLKANPGITSVKNARMSVQTAGKERLNVAFDLQDGKITNVWLRGSAKFIAKGEFYWS